jgi:CHAT domain-containing protein/NACHT domain-containing protein
VDDGIEELHQGFVGREAVLAVLDQLLVDDGIDRWVVLTGGRGKGKTALLARWLARRAVTRDLVPHHFVRQQRHDRVEPSAIARSLAAQIEERYPALRDPYARPQARLADLLTRVSNRELAPRGVQMVLLIDGLDEAHPVSDLRQLLAFLPRALPPGIRFLCAGRHRDPERDGFADRCGRLVRLDLDDPSLTADNDATIRALWQREAPGLGLDDRFIEHVVSCADGNVLHASALQRHLASVPPAERRPDIIPRGLPSLLAVLWQRVAGDPVAVRALGILCAAREPLSIEELGRVAGWSDLADPRAAVHVARALVVEARSNRRAPVYRLFHDAIRSYLVEQLGPAVIRGHHEELGQTLATWPAPREPAARRYTLQYALGHRIAAGDGPAIHALASNVDFLEAKHRELGVDDVELDVRRAVAACFAVGHSVLACELDHLARTIARESIALRADAGARASAVWQYLRQGTPHTAGVTARAPVPADDRRRVATYSTPLPDRWSSDRTLEAWTGDDGHAPTIRAPAASPPPTGRPTPAQAAIEPEARKPITATHKIILFLAANPKNTSRLDLEGECAAIEHELRLARHGNDFEFRSKWVVTVDEMARHLIDLNPTIIHFSGHGRRSTSGAEPTASRDVAPPGDSGIYLHDERHGVQLVTGRALALMVKASAPSTRLVVLNACYSDGHAEELSQVVDCVVGMTRAIHDHAAHSFAVAFYRALGHRFSVGNAVAHAVATLAAKQLPDESIPRCRTQNWSDAHAILL